MQAHSRRCVTGAPGDKLILDRDASNNVRMTVALNANESNDVDLFAGLVPAPTPPRPKTLQEELREKRSLKLPVDELAHHVLDFLWDRFGDGVDINEAMLHRNLETYLRRTSGV